MIETISGIVTAVVIIILAQLLSKYFSIKLFATTVLVAIAFIYVGFSLKDNPVKFIILESGVAVAFYFLAMIGYTRNSLLLSYCIIFHGIWDILHHNAILIGTDMAVYWPTFCLTVDVIDGLYFLVIFKRQTKSQ